MEMNEICYKNILVNFRVSGAGSLACGLLCVLLVLRMVSRLVEFPSLWRIFLIFKGDERFLIILFIIKKSVRLSV